MNKYIILIYIINKVDFSLIKISNYIIYPNIINFQF